MNTIDNLYSINFQRKKGKNVEFGYFMLFVSFSSIFKKIQEKPFLEKLFCGSFLKYPKVKDCICFFHFLLPIFFFITA